MYNYTYKKKILFEEQFLAICQTPRVVSIWGLKGEKKWEFLGCLPPPSVSSEPPNFDLQRPKAGREGLTILHIHFPCQGRGEVLENVFHHLLD